MVEGEALRQIRNICHNYMSIHDHVLASPNKVPQNLKEHAYMTAPLFKILRVIEKQGV